jgi:hypothetical protein
MMTMGFLPQFKYLALRIEKTESPEQWFNNVYLVKTGFGRNDVVEFRGISIRHKQPGSWSIWLISRLPIRTVAKQIH